MNKLVTSPNQPQVRLDFENRQGAASFEKPTLAVKYSNMLPSEIPGKPAVSAAYSERNPITGEVRVGGGHLRRVLESETSKQPNRRFGKGLMALGLTASVVLGIAACDNAESQGDTKSSAQVQAGDIKLADASKPTSDIFRYTNGDPTKVEDDKVTQAFGGKVSQFDFANPQALDTNKNTIENAKAVTNDLFLNIRGNSSIASPHLMAMAHTIHVAGFDIPDMQRFLSEDGKKVVDPKGLDSAMQAFADKVFKDTQLDSQGVPLNKEAHDKVTQAIDQLQQKYEANLGSMQFTDETEAYSTLQLLENNAVEYLQRAYPDGKIDLASMTIDGRTVTFSLACGDQLHWKLDEPAYVAPPVQQAPATRLMQTAPQWEDEAPAPAETHEAPQEEAEEYVQEAPAPAPAPQAFVLPPVEQIISNVVSLLPQVKFQQPIIPPPAAVAPPADKHPGQSSRAGEPGGYTGNNGQTFGANNNDHNDDAPTPLPSRNNPKPPVDNQIFGGGAGNSTGGGGFHTGTTPETRSSHVPGAGQADTDTSTSKGEVGPG